MRKKIMFLLARIFGRYVEVDKPALKYRAYLWRGNYYFVGKPFALNVRPTPIINMNCN